jgi:hypothetical protein
MRAAALKQASRRPLIGLITGSLKTANSGGDMFSGCF